MYLERYLFLPYQMFLRQSEPAAVFRHIFDPCFDISWLISGTFFTTNQVSFHEVLFRSFLSFVRLSFKIIWRLIVSQFQDFLSDSAVTNRTQLMTQSKVWFKKELERTPLQYFLSFFCDIWQKLAVFWNTCPLIKNFLSCPYGRHFHQSWCHSHMLS